MREGRKGAGFFWCKVTVTKPSFDVHAPCPKKKQFLFWRLSLKKGEMSFQSFKEGAVRCQEEDGRDRGDGRDA